MGGLATPAMHQWGPAEKRPVTGEPCTGTASLLQSTYSSAAGADKPRAGPGWRRVAVWPDHLSQDMWEGAPDQLL